MAADFDPIILDLADGSDYSLFAAALEEARAQRLYDADNQQLEIDHGLRWPWESEIRELRREAERLRQFAESISEQLARNARLRDGGE